MAGLTGIRLAIYDELLRGGVIDDKRLMQLLQVKTDLQAALAWLAQRRFIRRTGACWAANSPPSARTAWEQAGLAESYSAAAIVETTAEAVREQPMPRERPVQAHQAEIFAMEGYGF